jgi:Fe2+ or Zn2+ uptake regulation protein
LRAATPFDVARAALLYQRRIVSAAHRHASGANFTADVRLRDAGLRKTPVRVSVLELLGRNARPMSVPQILAKLKGVDTVTVYRTLGTFVEKRLAHRVRGGGGDRTWMYALGAGATRPDDDANGAAPAHNHPHFVCDACGKVECVEEAEIPSDFVASLGVGSAYAVSYPEVVLHGVCAKCGGVGQCEDRG